MKDSEVIADVVRKYFEQGWDEGATGKLARINRLFRSMSSEQVYVEDPTVKINELAVDEISLDRALVSFDATMNCVVHDQLLGNQRVRTHFTGPVVLRRAEGEWKIEDYVVEGRRVSDFSFLVSQSNKEHAITVSVKAVQLDSDGTTLLMKIRNGRPDPLSLFKTRLRLSRWRSSPGRIVGAGEILQPGEEIITLSRYRHALPLNTREVRAILKLREIDYMHPQTFRIEMTVRLDDADMPARARDGGPYDPID